MRSIVYAVLAWFIAIHWAFAAVNINTATESELDKLPGIGPAKAKAIVEDRKKNGPFKSADDLKRVTGIGDKNYEKLKSEITVEGASAAVKPDAKPEAKSEIKTAAKTETKAPAKPSSAVVSESKKEPKK